MTKIMMSRRNFLKFSGSALALAAASPYLNFVSAQEAVTLRIGSWDNTDAEPIEAEVMALFRDKFPNIEGNFEFVPDSYSDRIVTGLAGGNAPDVFLWWNFPNLVERDGLEDLTSYIEGESSLDTSIYYPEVLNYNRVGDGIYGLPKDFTSRAIFYNKTLFDDAGIPYPTEEWTWDEFLEIATELTKGEGPDKQYGFYNYTGTYPLQYFVWSNGGDFISPDGAEASGYLDSPETIEALDWYVRLQTEHGLTPTKTDEATTGGPGDLFLNGKLAMLDNGRWPQTQFLDTPDLDFGTVLPPKSWGGDRVTVLHEAGWCMNPATGNKEEAWELIKWLAGPEANRIRAEAGWAVPALPSVAEDLGFLDDPIEKTWFEAVQYATTTPCFLRNPNWPKADEEIGLAIESAFLTDVSVEEALTNAAPLVDRRLQGR